MRRTWWVVVVMLGACTTQPMERARRWPDHRKQTDERFAELERRATVVEKRNSELEALVAQLQRRLTKLEQPSAPPPTP